MDEATLREMWGALALRGMAAILFGLAAVFWPGLTLVTLVYLFAAYIVATGLINMVVGLVNLGGAESFWGRILLLLLGVAELGIGVYLFRHPGLTFTTFILLIGLLLIVRGLLDVGSGFFGDSSTTHKTVMVFGGLLAVIIGVLMLFQPAASGVAFVWVLGLYALVTGPLLLAMAFDAKKLAAAK